MRRVRANGGSREDFLRDARVFFEERDEAAKHEKPKKKLSDKLKAYITEHGEESSDGDLIVRFPKPITINGVQYLGLRKEKRATPLIDEEAAMKLVEKKNLLGQIPSWTEYDWEDGLYRLNAQKKITDKELESVQDESVTWALQVIK